MSLDTETIARHELVGLSLEVVEAPNRDLVAVSGRVIQETRQTILLRPEGTADSPLGDPSERPRRVPKAETTLQIRLPSGEAVRVEGDRLVGRPARRTETTGDSVWV